MLSRDSWLHHLRPRARHSCLAVGHAVMLKSQLQKSRQLSTASAFDVLLPHDHVVHGPLQDERVQPIQNTRRNHDTICYSNPGTASCLPFCHCRCQRCYLRLPFVSLLVSLLLVPFVSLLVDVSKIGLGNASLLSPLFEVYGTIVLPAFKQWLAWLHYGLHQTRPHCCVSLLLPPILRT